MKPIRRMAILENKYIIVGVLFLVIALSQLSCKSYFEPVKVENDFDRYRNEGIPIEPGKCFGKSGFIDSYTYEEELVAVYMGDDYGVKGLQFRKFLVEPEKSKFIWMTPSNREYPERPYNGYEWYFTKQEAKIGEFYEVIDTNFVRDFLYEKIKVAILYKGKHKEWVEVLCKEEMTKELIVKLKEALIEKGYGQKLNVNGKITRETYRALGYCQFNNDLPIGNLDLISFKFLGIEY